MTNVVKGLFIVAVSLTGAASYGQSPSGEGNYVCDIGASGPQWKERHDGKTLKTDFIGDPSDYPLENGKGKIRLIVLRVGGSKDKIRYEVQLRLHISLGNGFEDIPVNASAGYETLPKSFSLETVAVGTQYRAFALCLSAVPEIQP